MKEEMVYCYRYMNSESALEFFVEEEILITSYSRIHATVIKDRQC